MSGTTEEKHIQKDAVFRLLFLNMLLVIVGYALGVLTGMASVGPMRILKYSFLLFSMLYLFKINQNLLRVLAHYLQALILLSVTFLFFALLSSDPVNSLVQVLTFIVPFLYVAFSVGYLMVRYSIQGVLHAFINSINWVYFIPVMSYFLTGGKLTDTNIYYVSSENEEAAFVSNHYGWAGTLFLLTGMDLLRNVSLPWWRKLLLVAFGAIAAYLVLISGNRTSWLSLGIVAILFIFKYQGLRIYQKSLLSLFPIGMVLFLLQDPTSALNARLEKTRIQQKKGEARVNASNSMVSYFNQTPEFWVTGIGMFNKAKINSLTGWSGYHNSYYEVLFGSGIVVFAFFMYLIVGRSLWHYLLIFATRYLFFLPLLIIPFFESNLTGGQFLFFPWFIMAILMSYARKFAQIQNWLNENELPIN
jgi:hypothetical protein